MFFDEHPRFYETSETAAHRGRLNLRYEAIFAENRDIFAGARVLDIASHDGRWSLAALKTGAAEVVGIEARDELVHAARENLERYAGDGRHRFVAGDVFEVLAREQIEADVVLCLGYLYHTLRFSELMHRLREIGPGYLVIDTTVLPSRRAPVVRLRREPAGPQKNAVADAYSFGETTLVGWPSLPALELMVGAYGFAVERYSDWGSLLRDNPELQDDVDDYAEARRVTARCVSIV
jgi:Methyltransferase domain